VTTSVVAPATVVAKPVVAQPRVLHPEKPTLRLPAGVAPSSYEIHATIDPRDEVFKAVTRIALKLDAPVDRLWLNQDGLDFGSVTVELGQRRLAATAKPEESNFVAIELPEPIGPGPATLVLETIGKLSRDGDQGLLVGTEDDRDAVFSDFEPTGARSAFPVFDEPCFKVPWQLTLTVPSGLIALSNTPVERERVTGAVKTVTFARTAPMSSYLLALAIGDFDVVDAGKAGTNQVPLRIVTPKGQAARAAWAVETFKEAVERSEAWFGTPIPYGKIDLVAVTSGGFSGAMENPGLITFGSTLLLSGATGDSIHRRRSFVSTLVHELAHQWFGNLVTAAWWDDIWLNESFAEHVMLDVTASWKPEWEIGLERVSTRIGAMSSDSLTSARRIREPIVTNDDIANVFDTITYSKGASVLFMLERWVTPATFRAGVRSHLRAHAHGNATAKDFLAAMSAAAGFEVSAPFTAFADQQGVPLISWTLNCTGAPSVTLRQSRYGPLGSSLPPMSWSVPICMKWEGGRQCTLLDGPEATVTLTTNECPTWLVLNDEAMGYFLESPVSAATVLTPKLSIEERVGLADNLSQLVQRGTASPAEEFALVAPFIEQGHPALVERASQIVRGYAPALPAGAKKKLAALTRAQFGPAWKRVGLLAKAGEAEAFTLLRSDLFFLLGTLGEDHAIRAEAMKMAKRWLRDRNSVSSELLGGALVIAGLANDRALIELAMAELRREPDRKNRRHLTHLLGGVTDPKLAERVLGLLLDESLDPRELVGVAFELSESDETREAVLRWVKKNYDAWVELLPEDWHASLVLLGTGLCSKDRRSEVVAFFEPRVTKSPGGPREFAMAMEQYDQCVAYRAVQVPAVVRFLEGKK
jgi:alanyl aminopeptidase